MLILAATTLEKLQALPSRVWVNLALAVLGLMAGILLVRHAARMNRFILGMIVFLFLTVVGFQWVYERNEPRVLTPVINKIAPFFPSKLGYRGHD